MNILILVHKYLLRWTFKDRLRTGRNRETMPSLPKNTKKLCKLTQKLFGSILKIIATTQTEQQLTPTLVNT